MCFDGYSGFWCGGSIVDAVVVVELKIILFTIRLRWNLQIPASIVTRTIIILTLLTCRPSRGLPKWCQAAKTLPNVDLANPDFYFFDTKFHGFKNHKKMFKFHDFAEKFRI